MLIKEPVGKIYKALLNFYAEIQLGNIETKLTSAFYLADADHGYMPWVVKTGLAKNIGTNRTPCWQWLAETAPTIEMAEAIYNAKYNRSKELRQ